MMNIWTWFYFLTVLSSCPRSNTVCFNPNSSCRVCMQELKRMKWIWIGLNILLAVGIFLEKSEFVQFVMGIAFMCFTEEWWIQIECYWTLRYPGTIFSSIYRVLQPDKMYVNWSNGFKNQLSVTIQSSQWLTFIFYLILININ